MRSGIRAFGFHKPHPNRVPCFPKTSTKSPAFAFRETSPTIFGQIEGWNV